jgi:asparagine synthase (glutamine-hydrolysing)
LRSIDKILIRDFLTIRYTPKNPPINPVSWNNLLQKTTDPSGKKTQELLEKSTFESIPNNDEPIVVSLSSGIDSTLCLALLRKKFPKRRIIAICAVFSTNFDESQRAKIIAEKFHAEFKVIFVDSIFSNMPELVSITKKPRWNTYQHLIAREAKKFGKILVTGDGADEVFAGYAFRYAKFLRLSHSSQNWKTKVVNYLECHNRDWVPDQKKMFDSTIKFDWEKIYSYFQANFQNKLSSLEQVLISDFNGKLLYDFIPTANSIAKNYKIKTIPIFLNCNVIDFGLKLPLNQKFNQKTNQGKLTLRKIAKRLGIDHINEKRGFSPDLIMDWNDHGRKICEKYILKKDSYIFKKKIINYDWMLRAFEKVDNDGDIRYLNKMISLLALEIWLRIFILNEMNSKKLLK